MIKGDIACKIYKTAPITQESYFHILITVFIVGFLKSTNFFSQDSLLQLALHYILTYHSQFKKKESSLVRIFFLFFIQKYLFNTFLTVILYFSYLFIFFICTSTYKKIFFLNAISFYQQM